MLLQPDTRQLSTHNSRDHAAKSRHASPVLQQNAVSGPVHPAIRQ